MNTGRPLVRAASREIRTGTRSGPGSLTQVKQLCKRPKAQLGVLLQVSVELSHADHEPAERSS